MSTYGLQGSITLKNDSWVDFGHPAASNSWYFEWSVYKESGSWKLKVKAEARNSKQLSYAYGGYEILLDATTVVGKRNYGGKLQWDTADSTNANKYSEIHIHDLGKTPSGTINLNFIGLNSSQDNKYKAVQNITINLYEYRDAPTITTTERSYISGADDFTIEWDNSNDDINAFSDYSVIVKIGNTQIHSGTQDGSSYTIKADELSASRGKTLTIQISSNGEHDNEATGSRKFANYETKVNRLPSLEFVTESQTVASNNTSQSVIVKVKGTESDSGQSIKYYYSKFSASDETKFLINVNKDGEGEISGRAEELRNYYFYAYDGYEYSEPYKSNVVINTVPNFDISYTYAQEDSINLKEGEVYATYLEIATLPNGGQEANNSYKYSISYGTDKNALKTSVDFTTKSTEMIIPNIRDYIPNIEDHVLYGYYYKISITRNDGIEEFTKEIEQIFYVTKKPKIEFQVQKTKSHTLNGKDYYHFDDKLIIQIEYDTGYNSFEFELTPNNSFALVNQQALIPFTQCEILKQDGTNKNSKYQYTLNFQKQNTGGYITGSISAWLDNDEENKETKNIAQISQIALRKLEGASTYKPYTATGWSLSFGVPSGFGNSENKNIYGFYSNDPKPDLILSYEGKTVTIEGLTPGKGSSDSTLQLSIEGNTLYSWLERLELNKNSSTVISAYIQYTNEFSSTSISNILLVNIDYREEIEVLDWDMRPSRSPDIPFESWEYLKQGVEFKYTTLEFKTYNALDNIRIYWVCGTISDEICNFGPQEISDINYPDPYSPTKEIEFDYSIPKVTQDCNGIFYAEFKRADGSVDIKQLGEKQFYRHIEPSTSFASITYQPNNEELLANFLVSDLGVPSDKLDEKVIKQVVEQKWYFVEQGQGFSEDNEFAPQNDGYSCGYVISKDFVHLAPCLVTTFSARYIGSDGKPKNIYPTKVKQTSFVYSIVYNLLPTISYRQNHLGINTLSPSEKKDSIIYIGTYGERNTIYFVSENNQQRIVDISTGAISNFVLDGGSWDNTPGGVIPGGGSGDVPAGLARIAYTGEVVDLEQDRTDTIIISGGSSVEQI